MLPFFLASPFGPSLEVNHGDANRPPDGLHANEDLPWLELRSRIHRGSPAASVFVGGEAGGSVVRSVLNLIPLLGGNGACHVLIGYSPHEWHACRRRGSKNNKSDEIWHNSQQNPRLQLPQISQQADVKRMRAWRLHRRSWTATLRLSAPAQGRRPRSLLAPCKVSFRFCSRSPPSGQPFAHFLPSPLPAIRRSAFQS